MVEKQHVEIKPDGVYVNGAKVPGFIETGSVSVTPGHRESFTTVHLAILADTVDVQSTIDGR